MSSADERGAVTFVETGPELMLHDESNAPPAQSTAAEAASIEEDDDNLDVVEELLIDRFGKRSHVELRLNSRVFIPVSLVSHRHIVTTIPLAQTVIELASAKEELWFNSNRALYNDVQQTVRQIHGIEELARPDAKALKKPIEGVATGMLTKLNYRIMSQPAPYTLLLPSTSGGYAALEYCGFHLEVQVSPKKRFEEHDREDAFNQSAI